MSYKELATKKNIHAHRHTLREKNYYYCMWAKLCSSVKLHKHKGSTLLGSRGKKCSSAVKDPDKYLCHLLYVNVLQKLKAAKHSCFFSEGFHECETQ